MPYFRHITYGEKAAASPDNAAGGQYRSPYFEKRTTTRVSQRISALREFAKVSRLTMNDGYLFITSNYLSLLWW